MVEEDALDDEEQLHRFLSNILSLRNLHPHPHPTHPAGP